MAFRLPRFPRAIAIVDKLGLPTRVMQQWIQSFAETIEAQENRQDDLLEAIQAAQAAAELAQTNANAAQTAANNAQAAADAAQEAIDNLPIPPTGTTSITADYALSEADATILVDATAGPINIFLPSASLGSVTVLGPFTIKKVDASTNAVTIVPDGSDTINGGSSIDLTTQYESRTVNTDGVSAWFA